MFLRKEPLFIEEQAAFAVTVHGEGERRVEGGGGGKAAL